MAGASEAIGREHLPVSSSSEPVGLSCHHNLKSFSREDTAWDVPDRHQSSKACYHRIVSTVCV